MLCYNDRTYCPFWKSCADGDICNIALTSIIKEKAVKWWGSDDAPIMVYTEPPEYCYKENKENVKND